MLLYCIQRDCSNKHLVSYLYSNICICLMCFPRQNLEQCRRAELWPAARETEGPPAQGQGGGVLLWGYDCPQHPHGYETPSFGGRFSPHRQVSLFLNIMLWTFALCVTVEIYQRVLVFLSLLCAIMMRSYKLERPVGIFFCGPILYSPRALVKLGGLVGISSTGCFCKAPKMANLLEAL